MRKALRAAGRLRRWMQYSTSFWIDDVIKLAAPTLKIITKAKNSLNKKYAAKINSDTMVEDV